MAKSLFNFYLDDDVKKKATTKIERLVGEQPKGQFAALIRVMINQFIATPDSEISDKLIEAVKSEYQLTTYKNKRSKM